MLPIESPFPLYVDLDGDPLDAGFIYFGALNQNPVTNPITVYWDSAGTMPVLQPIRTENGLIVRNGSPAHVFVNSSYSMLVQDKKQRQIYFEPNSNDFSIANYVANFFTSLASNIGSTLVGFIQAGIGAIKRTVQDELRETLKPQQFGALGDGTTDDTAAFIALRNQAALVKGRVVVPAGTYRIQSGTDLAANDTIWKFNAGAVLKLTDAQATTSFITFTSPVNQRIYDMRVNANRPVQNAALFGQDNCAVLVVNANNCTINGMEIINSPAKGLALVSSPGSTTRNVGISNFIGADCNAQVLIVDGNNMTGFFDRVTINGVRIGATGHAGVALNDGASSITLSDVISDTQNTIHDAVSIRDSFDIQLTNIRGRRARNGISLERLNGYTGRIQLSNVVGEFNSQNGVLMLGAEDVTAGVVVGRNNGGVGINIAQTGALYRCKNIEINAPAGYDDQGGGATQDYGILVQGLNTGRLGSHIAYGNTTRNLSINRSVCTNVKADTRQTASVSTGSIAASGETTINVNWPTAFEDAGIDLEAPWLFEATGTTALAVGHVQAITQNVVQVRVYNRSGTTAHTATLNIAGSRTP